MAISLLVIEMLCVNSIVNFKMEGLNKKLHYFDIIDKMTFL